MLLSEVGISDTGLCWLSFSCLFARHHMRSRIWFVYFGPQPLKPLKNSDSNCWQRCQAPAPVQYPNTATLHAAQYHFSSTRPSLEPLCNKRLSRIIVNFRRGNFSYPQPLAHVIAFTGRALTLYIHAAGMRTWP